MTAGETEPATKHLPVGRPAAVRAIRTPAALISATRSPCPDGASRSRLAPNVFVCTMSTPASM